MLNPNNTLFEELLETTSSREMTHEILGRFRFAEEDHDKLIGELSGGERSRVALGRLTATPSNLLIMDEPTNHLDIDSLGVLEKALNDYGGTLLVISHDRYFIDQIAEEVWELAGGQINVYHGNYSHYRDRKKQEQLREKREQEERSHRKREPSSNSTTGVKKDETQRRERRRVLLEEEIMEIEDMVSSLEEEFCDPTFSDREPDEIATKNRRYKKLRSRLEELYGEWDELVG